MEKPSSSRGYFLLCALLMVVVALCRVPGARSQEVEDEKDFSYVPGSANGPERWGDLHEEWGMCKNGTMQSPIDLTDKRVGVVPGLGRLKRSYKPAKAKLKNRGHDIKLEWLGDAGSIHIDGTEYHLKQCHWHSPSEHSINGIRFAMEVHLVHQSSDNKIAVLGIMYKRGRPETFLSPLMDPLKSIAGSTDLEREVGVVDPTNIKLGSRKYYRYLGSLTTPPCDQGVVWSITRKVRTVSMEQVSLLREAVKDHAEKNARPLQPNNQRAVEFYRPQPDEERPRR
uniref:Carbonic anhydrase n=1 Tax=Anthurium amnicola TaxID=1678845 RepID=A0A1D1YRF3_9ARAE